MSPDLFAEEDYHCYLHWLQESAVNWECAIHVYVLMTNHVHLLLDEEAIVDIRLALTQGQSLGSERFSYQNRVNQLAYQIRRVSPKCNQTLDFEQEIQNAKT